MKFAIIFVLATMLPGLSAAFDEANLPTINKCLDHGRHGKWMITKLQEGADWIILTDYYYLSDFGMKLADKERKEFLAIVDKADAFMPFTRAERQNPRLPASFEAEVTLNCLSKHGLSPSGERIR